MKNTSFSETITLGGQEMRRLGLGTNRITDTDSARAVLRRAYDLGIHFIDTADRYQSGQSEETIAKTFPAYPRDLIIATKGGMSGKDGSANNDPEYLRQALAGSLKRLNREHIDLYQLHRTDPNVPIEQTAQALKEMQDYGTIRLLGLSEVTVEQIEAYRNVIDVVSVQNQYNLLERKYEAVLDYCEANGIIFIPWFPLARGKFDTEELDRIARTHDATPAQIAIAWLLMRSPVMLPIPGTLSIQHLEQNIAALSIRLSEDEFETLDTLAMAPQ